MPKKRQSANQELWVVKNICNDSFKIYVENHQNHISLENVSVVAFAMMGNGKVSQNNKCEIGEVDKQKVQPRTFVIGIKHKNLWWT